MSGRRSITQARARTVAISCALLLASSPSADAVLTSGDTFSGRMLVRYSGESVTWIACAADMNPGDYAEFQMRDSVTGLLVRAGSSPLTADRFVFEVDVPRVGVFDGRVRSCNDAGPCSEWVSSTDNAGQDASCATGNDYVLATLAPAGAVTVE